MKKKKPYNVVPQKFEQEFEYNDVKPADQSGDNDIDRITRNEDADGAKKQTDESYMNQQTGTGTETSGGRV